MRWWAGVLAAVLAGGPAAAATSAPAAAGCVQVVVDYGTLPGAPRSPSAVCLPPREGTSGADVLVARAAALRRPPPRFDADGLVCAIDGLPPTGCAEGSVGSYRYWSYWHRSGDGPWEYSAAGAFAYTVHGARPSEGWAWTEGAERTRRPPDVPYGTTSDRPAAAPATAGGNGGAGGGPPLALLAGIALVVAVGGAAVVRARRSA